MAWSEHIDDLKWIPLKNVAEGVAITKLLGISFDKQTAGGHELRWSVATIEPGGKFSWHEHPHPQCFYFVKGEGEVQLEHEVVPVSPGSIVTLDDREGHEVRNTGSGEMFLMEVSLFHAEESVPTVEPHPALAAEEERAPGLAIQLHGAVRRGVRGAAAGGERPRRTAATWLQAVRPFSFTASIVPILLGTVLGALAGGFDPVLAVLALVGGVALHAGSNLVSDYFDFRTGVDAEDTYGSSGVITGGLLSPQEVFLGGLVAFALALAVGGWMAAVRGPVIVLLGIIGLLGGYFYTGRPVGLKYVALGDALIFALFGPLMVFGAWFAQTGVVAWTPMLVALPVGLLVTAILHANNVRDIPFDARAGIRTLAISAGGRGARVLYGVLVAGAYLSTLVMTAVGVLHPAALAVLLSLPIALKVTRTVFRSTEPSDLAAADVMTAQLHMVFGLLLTAGVLAGGLF